MKLTNLELAVVLGRLLLGTNFLFHGLTRLPRLPTFREHLLKQFGPTVLPPELVVAFGTVLPFVEAGLGLLLLLGWLTRPALVGILLTLTALTAGSCLVENWPVVGDQLVYGLFALALLAGLRHNRLCVDAVSA